MKQPQFSRIRTEDVKDAPAWLYSLINPLNQFMDFINRAMNNSLTITENLSAFSFSFTLKDTDFPFIFKVGSSKKVTDLILSSIDADSPAHITPSSAQMINWTYDPSNQSITLYTITGILGSQPYKVRLLAFCEP